MQFLNFHRECILVLCVLDSTLIVRCHPNNKNRLIHTPIAIATLVVLCVQLMQNTNCCKPKTITTLKIK